MIPLVSITLLIDMLCFIFIYFSRLMSNDVTLSVIGEDLNADTVQAEEDDETPQQLAERTLNDVFKTSIF